MPRYPEREAFIAWMGKDWETERFESFQARLESVKPALRKRKSMIASCFDYVFRKRLIASPSKEKKTKKSKKDVNTKRAGDLNLAKMVKTGGQQESCHKRRQVVRPPRKDLDVNDTTDDPHNEWRSLSECIGERDSIARYEVQQAIKLHAIALQNACSAGVFFGVNLQSQDTVEIT